MTLRRALALTACCTLALTAPAALAEHQDAGTGPVLVVDDAAGDATGFVVESTPLPSSPTLDLREARMSWDAAARSLKVVLSVTDLTAEPPAGATGKTYYVNFAFDGTRYFLTAQQELTGTPTFVLGDFGGTNGGRRNLPTVAVTGALDPAANTVTMTLKATEFRKATGAPVVTPGESVFEVADVLAQRTLNGVAATLTPTADTAAGIEVFEVPAPPAQD